MTNCTLVSGRWLFTSGSDNPAVLKCSTKCCKKIQPVQYNSWWMTRACRLTPNNTFAPCKKILLHYGHFTWWRIIIFRMRIPPLKQSYKHSRICWLKNWPMWLGERGQDRKKDPLYKVWVAASQSGGWTFWHIHSFNLPHYFYFIKYHLHT